MLVVLGLKIGPVPRVPVAIVSHAGPEAAGLEAQEKGGFEKPWCV